MSSRTIYHKEKERRTSVSQSEPHRVIIRSRSSYLRMAQISLLPESCIRVRNTCALLPGTGVPAAVSTATTGRSQSGAESHLRADVRIDLHRILTWPVLRE
jgi:hypothetical protein